MIKGILGFMMLAFGLGNLLSEDASFVGWVLSALGLILLATSLAGPMKKRPGQSGMLGGIAGKSVIDSDNGSSGGDFGDGGGE